MEQQRKTEAKLGADTTADIYVQYYKTGCVQLFCIVRIAICVCKTRICLLERRSSIGKLSCPNLYKLVAPDFQVRRPAGGDQSLRRNAVKGFVETQHLTQIFQRKI